MMASAHLAMVAPPIAAQLADTAEREQGAGLQSRVLFRGVGIDRMK